MVCAALALTPFAIFAVAEFVGQSKRLHADIVLQANAQAGLTAQHIQQMVQSGFDLLAGAREGRSLSIDDVEGCDQFLARLHTIAGKRYSIFTIGTAEKPAACRSWRPTSSEQTAVPELPVMVGDRAFSRLRIGAMSRRPVLVLGLPLVVGPNGTDAFIMAALDLTWVTDQMNGATVAHAFGLALTNGDGRIFAHAGLSHDEPIILGQTLLRDMKDVTILDGSAVNNIPGGMFVRPLVDANYVERVVTEQFHRSLMALATVLALGFFIFAIAVNRWVTPPIKAMRRLTDRLIAGDYGARSGITKGGTELLELAIRLDAVAGALQQREREAIDKGEHLAQALEAIDDGFAIFDPDDRLVVWNTKYEEVYASTKPALRVGATFEELIRLGVAHGQYPNAIGREEEWIKHRLALHRDPGERIEQPLPDGRWLRIKEHRTPDGSIVGLRTDITELKLREARLEEQAAQLSRYAHIASHDLQEPLRKIHTFSGILRRALDNGRTDDVDRAIEVMSKAAENGRTLVTDLLRYSKM
ncbi:MAG: PAS-domain containing protein [Alphaproteobacteria bacterium]